VWDAKSLSPKPGCVIAASDFGCPDVIQEMNRVCVSAGIHFLPVVLADFIGYVGPFVIPGETPCFDCFLSREESNAPDFGLQRALRASAPDNHDTIGFHPSMASVLGDMAAIELTKFYSHENAHAALPYHRVGHVIEVNLLLPELRGRRVLKLPRCPSCGSLSTRPPVNPRKPVEDLVHGAE
jgi:molybdopterin-synthase adenylyltransferase